MTAPKKIIKDGDRRSGDDIASTRHKTGLSQDEFADRYEIGRHQIRSWERGASKPTGPSRAYLALIDLAPQAIADMLRTYTPVRSAAIPGLPKRYRECGLNWVLIPPGSGVGGINGLHAAIVRHILRSRIRMSGAEMKFLRTEIGVDIEALASVFGVKAVTASKWEADANAFLSGSADLVMRTYVASRVNDVETLAFLPQVYGRVAEDVREDVMFELVGGNWIGLVQSSKAGEREGADAVSVDDLD